MSSSHKSRFCRDHCESFPHESDHKNQFAWTPIWQVGIFNFLNLQTIVVRRRHSIQLEVQSQFVEVSGTCDQNCFPAHGITTASLCNTSISKYYSARIGVVLLDLLLVPISHFLSRVLLCSFSHGSYFLNYKRRKQFFLRPTKRD